MANEDELKRRRTESRIGNTRIVEYSGIPSKGIAPRMELSPIKKYRMVEPTPVEKAPAAPVMPEVEKPTYFTKENSSLGWQERIARNRQLDENYRAALSSAGQKYSTDVTAQTTRGTAALRGRGDLAVRELQERGLGARQTAQQAHEASMQQQRIGAARGAEERGRSFQESQAEAERGFQLRRDEEAREAGIRSQREAAIPGLLAGGNIESAQQAELYSRHGPGAVYGLKPSASRGTRFEYIAPKVTTDLEGKSQMVTPPGTFDPSTGTTKYDVQNLPAEDMDKMIEALLKRKANRG